MAAADFGMMETIRLAPVIAIAQGRNVIDPPSRLSAKPGTSKLIDANTGCKRILFTDQGRM